MVVIAITLVVWLIGSFLLINNLYSRIAKLENQATVIYNALSAAEQPLFEKSPDEKFLEAVNSREEAPVRTKIPVAFKGSTYLVYKDATPEEVLKVMGNPTKTEGDEKKYNMYYWSASKDLWFRFKNYVLTEIS